MEIKQVMVIGAGLMGSGIAQVCAQSGQTVVLSDVSDHALEKAYTHIEWSVGKLVEKGKVKSDKETVMGRIVTSSGYDKGAEADLIIEAVFEDLPLKQKIIKAVTSVCRSDAVFASNTSAIPITELASASTYPDRMVGIHFFNPVPMMQAVEVIRAIQTSDQTAAIAEKFVRQIGKEPVVVNQDLAGFVINRINYPSTIQAIKLVEQGVASVADIDKGLRLASGRKMGIFETGDMVGLDVTYGAMMAIYHETGDAGFYPPMLLRRKVKAGHLGRKTGKGWYEYNEDGTKKE